MDWQHLQNAIDPRKRIETLIQILSLTESRQRRRLLVRGIIRREHRSRRRRVNFNNNRHGVQRRIPLIFVRVVFFFILLTISIATGLIAFHIHPHYAAPMLFVYQLLILAFILLTPRKRQRIGRRVGLNR